MRDATRRGGTQRGPLGRFGAATFFVLALACVSPAAAQQPAFFSLVATGDPDAGQTLTSGRVLVSYFDANGNNRVDLDRPQEPVYLDIEGNGVVGYGDIRLTAFAGHRAGTLVDVGDRDLGFDVKASGWFGREGGTWFVDVNGDRSVSSPDIALDTMQQVVSGDARIGKPLTAHDGEGQQRDTMWWLAQTAKYTTGQTLYLGVGPYVSGARVVSVDDLRFDPLGFSADLAPPTTSPASAPQTSATVERPAATTVTATQTVETTTIVQGSSGPWVMILGVLSLANLLGLVILARRIFDRPRNPFK